MTRLLLADWYRMIIKISVSREPMIRRVKVAFPEGTVHYLVRPRRNSNPSSDLQDQKWLKMNSLPCSSEDTRTSLSLTVLMGKAERKKRSSVGVPVAAFSETRISLQLSLPVESSVMGHG